MPLQLPNLDDRRYKDLVDEALALIPTHAPQWTNHNPSDPGITLIELFAFLSESLIYRLNRVTPANLLSFLKLLNGTDWQPLDENDQPLGKKPDELTPDEIRQQVPRSIRKLRKLERAVSRQDFESLALEASPKVARARCLPLRNLEIDLEGVREGHVSLIVLPVKEAEADIATVVSDVVKHLTPRLLLTTRLHVVKPLFLGVTVEADIKLLPDQKSAGIQEKALQEIERFFDPRPDALLNTPGWPFGRNVYVSEIYALLDQLPFVDFVKEGSVRLTANKPPRNLPNNTGLEVKPYELVKVEGVTMNIVT